MMPATVITGAMGNNKPVASIIEELLWRELISDSTDLGTSPVG